jgi:DNA-binding response OmpR family regulator
MGPLQRREETAMKLLIVEDTELLRTALANAFSDAGYSVDAFESGEEGLEAAEETRYDLIILDIGLPGIDGFQVVRELRESGDTTPLVILTSFEEEEGLVRSLDLGADDFIRKPFSMAELQAHARALLRRATLFQESTLTFGDLELDLKERTALRGGQPLRLTEVQFKVLTALMNRKGEVVSRGELYAEVWGLEFDPGTKILDVQLTYLRKKLRVTGPPLIQNVRGEGYRLALPDSSP